MLQGSRQSPLVSVLLPAYHAGGYLRPAVNSILSQSFTNIEPLIIDGFSSDGSFFACKILMT